jgi:RimJ/RimL family protein N-acetyltransferase
MGRALFTRNLELRPYTPQALLALIDGVEQFRQEFGLAAADGMRGFIVSDEVSPAWLARLRATTVAADPWIHGFAVVHPESRSVIGSAAFRGPPDDGAVEISYGIVPAFQGRGYATEAAEALVGFASSSPDVRLLVAHTAPTANASTRVLTKCGFVHAGEVVDPEDGLVWRWERGAQRATSR